MRNFLRVAQGINVANINASLFRHPELWNENTFRTITEGTAFSEVDDIWIRFPANPESLLLTENDSSNVWYPAVSKIPELKSMCLDLMHSIGGYEFGRIIITRLKSGCEMHPHADTHAYATQPNIVRYHIVLNGHPGSLFYCGEEEVVNMLTGEVWTFRADLVHAVVNNSKEDRIHLLVDMKIWPN